MVTMNKQQSISWWFCLGMIAIAAGMLMQHLRLPGGYLIGPLLVAIVAGLIRPDHPALATRILLAAQAVIGMLLATGIQPGIISGIAAYWMPVLLMVCITLGISFIAGIVLARITPLSRETATLGTLPGGATTMIAISMSAKADTRMVALMQYIRLVLTVVSAAVLARFIPHTINTTVHSALNLSSHPILLDLWISYLVTALITLAGAWLGRSIHLPAAALLGPLLAGIAIRATGLFTLSWPPGVAKAAYIIVGMYVGLLFDRASLLQAGRLIPVMIINTLVLMATCAVTGKMLSVMTGSSYLTGYLATTPGGMDSIAVIAMASGADITLILTTQMLRLLSIIIMGPILARYVLGKNS